MTRLATISSILLLGISWSLAASGQAPVIDSPHGELQENCSLCHSSAGWKPIQLSPEFDHARFGIRLEGAHADLYCGFCHSSLDFSGLDGGCVSCHVDAHDGELGFECQQCHGYRSFSELNDQLRMHRTSSFPLDGAHMSVPCESCHPPTPPGVNDFLLTSAECYSCHASEFSGVLEPDHGGIGFSTDCERCHRVTRWSDATFDHSGVRGIPCVDCHQDDYDGARNPAHSPPEFPLECQNCHNTIDWGDGRFEHREFFPVYSGAHREKWNSCSICHTSAGDFLVFSCLGCHPHSDQQETDDKHREAGPDYAYDSIECYRCHPNGRAADAVGN